MTAMKVFLLSLTLFTGFEGARVAVNKANSAMDVSEDPMMNDDGAAPKDPQAEEEDDGSNEEGEESEEEDDDDNEGDEHEDGEEEAGDQLLEMQESGGAQQKNTGKQLDASLQMKGGGRRRRRKTPAPTPAPGPAPVVYEELVGACRSSDGSEVQGYTCGGVTNDECLAVANAAQPQAIGYMFKIGDSECRVLGMKKKLKNVKDRTFTTRCKSGGAFMKGTDIASAQYGASGRNWRCYRQKEA